MAKKAMFLFLAVMIGLAGAVYAGPKEAAEIVKAAEREGKVTLTSSLKDDEIKPFIKAFQKEYPKIEIVPEREHGSAETLLRELVAGAEVNDVVQVHPDIENELIDMGFLDQGNWRISTWCPSSPWIKIRRSAHFSTAMRSFSIRN